MGGSLEVNRNDTIKGGGRHCHTRAFWKKERNSLNARRLQQQQGRTADKFNPISVSGQGEKKEREAE